MVESVNDRLGGLGHLEDLLLDLDPGHLHFISMYCGLGTSTAIATGSSTTLSTNSSTTCTTVCWTKRSC
eukprot:5544756-Alexandrium_andersonii.AAC.1